MSVAPFVPSPLNVVDKMLELAEVKPGETVYDLGCGDARIVIATARKYGAKAVESNWTKASTRTASGGLSKQALTTW